MKKLNLKNVNIKNRLNLKSLNLMKKEKVYIYITHVAKNSVVPVGMFLVFLPVRAYAEENLDTGETVDKTTKTKAFIMLVKSSMGITKCLDPTATPIEKLHACLKPCCAFTFVAATCLKESETVSARVKLLAGSCCAASWAAYSALEAKKAFK